MESNIVAGLVSGLTVTIIVLVFGKLWRTVIEPWFEERVYKDTHIEGKWYSLYVNSIDLRQETISISRAGHSVTGKMMCNTGEDDGEEYILKGSFRNLLLPMTYEAADRKKTDRGTVTLKSVHNGERLTGRVAMYNTKRDAISTAVVVWFRNKDDMQEQIKYIKEHRARLAEIRKKSEEVAEEFKEFFDEFYEEYSKGKKEQVEHTIEGEAKQIEDKS